MMSQTSQPVSTYTKSNTYLVDPYIRLVIRAKNEQQAVAKAEALLEFLYYLDELEMFTCSVGEVKEFAKTYD